MYNKFKIHIHNGNISKSIDGSYASRGVKIIAPNSTFEAQQYIESLKVWVLPSSVCSGASYYVYSPLNSSFTATIPNQKSCCLFMSGVEESIEYTPSYL